MRPRGVPETVNPIDHPVTFVIAENGSDVHVFIPAYFQMELVHYMAENLSRRVQEPVKVFHDSYREKYRLCPVSTDVEVIPDSYGTFCFECDCSEPKIIETQADEKQQEQVSEGSEARIRRPRNSWILYRQEMSKVITAENPGITAAEVSGIVSKRWHAEPVDVLEYWQQMAELEDQRHKEMHPDYKYTKKSSAKNKAT